MLKNFNDEPQKTKDIMKTVMQKAILLSMAFLMTMGLANAQKVIPKVGVNVSAIEANLGDFDAEVRRGWNAGVDLRLGNGIIFLNPGLHYYSYTAELTDGINSPGDVIDMEETTIRSLRAPLNLGIRITGTNGLFGVYAKGGVTPAYVLGVKRGDDISLEASDLNRFTMNASVGAGVDFLIFTADLTYDIGLDDFFADGGGANNMLTLGVGLKF